MADRKNHKEKAAAFSDAQKKKNAQASQPKTHLIPDVEWQSTDNLDLRGDVAEAIQNNLVVAFEALQKAGQAFQVLLNLNIKAGKAKLKYTWNNGEIPTDSELKEYQEQMNQLQALKAEQLKKAQDGIAAEAKKNQTSKTNLVTTDGQPLTEENLSKSKSGLIV
jgi:hypothetical protein